MSILGVWPASQTEIAPSGEIMMGLSNVPCDSFVFAPAPLDLAVHSIISLEIWYFSELPIESWLLGLYRLPAIDVEQKRQPSYIA